MKRDRRRGRARRRDGGFNLLEIMVVLAIIGLLVASVGRAVFLHYTKARLKIAHLQVREVSEKIQQYSLNGGECPTVEELVRSRYLNKEPVDPWGMAMVIKCPGEHDPDGADVISYGPDKREGTDDDVVSWRDPPRKP